MRPVRTFHVRPALPERLLHLETIAYNFRWSWNHDARALFRRLDPGLWEEVGHNPVLLLGSLPQERITEASEDEAFLAHLDRVKKDLDDYLNRTGTWFCKHYARFETPQVAYFSMEFGITECLPIYSGGLGILAGDHLKSASELGVPLIGVGLLYQKGYFRQYLTPEGWQQERYPENDFSVMPIRPWHDAAGNPVRIPIELDHETVIVRPWRAQVGRISLLLLDSNLPENPAHLQDITDQLYGGDLDLRLRQEAVLGIGGVKALTALGLHPLVWHMNEGHCAFLSLERIRMLMTEGRMVFREALEAAAASAVFTTHTPVPAGIDVFPPDMIERYFHKLRSELGLGREELLDLGRIHPGQGSEGFNMAMLALRTSRVANGVSRLHGRVARSMWQDAWRGVPVTELPIGHVTNGVHAQTWISEDMSRLYDRYLGPRWSEEPGDTRVWAGTDRIPGEELWRTHERRRARLVAWARRRLTAQIATRGAGPAEMAAAAEALDPEALTIGFARRFATYKRATLLLRDPARLERLINAAGRPVQFIFAGKAHPRDEPGKELIRQVIQLVRQPEFRRRIVFLEDYDQVVARYMVQGVDVWLNTPRRPLEASGTSGMKAAVNGALNLSVLDGWWDEAWDPNCGWAIGRGEDYSDGEYQDRIEAGALYELLESEVVPVFYDRGADGLPRGWIAKMKSAIGELCPRFNTNRMVHDYVTGAYAPALVRWEGFSGDAFARSRRLAAWKDTVRRAWDGVQVTTVEVMPGPDLRVGSAIPVRAFVVTGGLDPGDLRVECGLGRTGADREMIGPAWEALASTGRKSGDAVLYEGVVTCRWSGTQGITVRALPNHPDLTHLHELGLIAWARP